MTDLYGHTLLAAIPPGSIERDVSALQNALFADRGCISAVALSPLIPVAFLPDGAPRGAGAAAVAGAVRGGARFRSTGWAREGGWLYLALESQGVWEALERAVAEALRRVAAPDAAPLEAGRELFPVRQGFFMGCGEDGGAGAEQGREVPALSFSSCSLALVRLRSAAAGAWWREVYLEVVDKAALR